MSRFRLWMRLVFIAIAFLRADHSAGMQIVTASQTEFRACLPQDIKPSDVVSARIIEVGNNNIIEKVTVSQRLSELRAYCKNEQLVDGAGRALAFYKLTGCWGNPPANYQEILEQQRAQIEKLRTRFTVIEMTCNPTRARIP